MKLTEYNLADLYVVLKAKGLETGKKQIVTLHVKAEDWGEFDEADTMKILGYRYTGKPDGSLHCDLLMQLRNIKTGKIRNKPINDTEFIYSNELPKTNFSSLEYNKKKYASFKSLANAIGIKMAVVASKIPVNLKYHLDIFTRNEDTTISEVIRERLEIYAQDKLIENAKNLMYQKPANLI